MHQRSSPATFIGFALLAGLVAGLLVACFHFFATEPTLQNAIDLETARKLALGQPDPQVFTRPEQRAGLFLGYVLYGIGWGCLFGTLCWFAFGQERLSGARKVSWKWFFTLLFICYWTFCLFPQLKYPANPPGIGDATTITIRQTLYLAGIGLSILGTVLALLLYRSLQGLEEQGRLARCSRVLIVLLSYGVYVALFWAFLPPYPVPVPAASVNMVQAFRWLSAVGVALFWFLLGALFWFFWQRHLARQEHQQQGRKPRPLLAK